MKRKTPAQQRKIVEKWNAKYSVGQPVAYWPFTKDGPGVESKTRTPAQMLSGHTAVVWVEGRGDCIALTHVEAR